MTKTERRASQAYVKIHAARCELEIRAFITTFHAWIRDKKTEDLLIDVHDYSHVHEGPGVVLVAHQAHYGMDRRDGRLGLVYRVRRDGPGPVVERLTSAAARALAAAALLEEEHGARLSFATDDVLFGFEDRLHAPNDETTFAAFEPDLLNFAKRLLGPEAVLSREGDDRDVFGARARGDGVSLAEMARRVAPGTAM